MMAFDISIQETSNICLSLHLRRAEEEYWAIRKARSLNEKGICSVCGNNPQKPVHHEKMCVDCDIALVERGVDLEKRREILRLCSLGWADDRPGGYSFNSKPWKYLANCFSEGLFCVL